MEVGAGNVIRLDIEQLHVVLLFFRVFVDVQIVQVLCDLFSFRSPTELTEPTTDDLCPNSKQSHLKNICKVSFD